jgi:hypothetical protein
MTLSATRPRFPTKAALTRLRNTIVKEIIRYVAFVHGAQVALEERLRERLELIGTVIDLAPWVVEEFGPSINAYFDPPKTLEELQQAVQDPQRGYDIHHIVEQTPAEKDGFPRSLIDSSENVVRIPRFKHWQITGWFGAENEDYGLRPPREFLRGKDWEMRVEVGKRALIKAGVLKP